MIHLSDSELSAVIEKYREEGAAVMQHLRKLDSLKVRLQDAKSKQLTEIHAHQNSMTRLKEEIRLMQDECPHVVTRYYGDPAGGWDSFHECETCGKQF